MLTSVSIHAGAILDPETLCSLRHESASREALGRALALVARSRHTRRALEAKLERRGYEPAVIRRVIDRLCELGYLDDEAAAESWLSRRVERRPEGRLALLSGLLRNGVPRDMAERLLDRHLSPEQEAHAALRVLRRLYPTEQSRSSLCREPARSGALRKLLSRGFSRKAARLALPPRTGRGEDEEG